MRTTPHLATLDGYQSSKEILTAIEEIAKDEFDANDETTDAHRIWSSPTDDEMKRVSAIAWALADAYEETLSWGSETLRRVTT